MGDRHWLARSLDWQGIAQDALMPGSGRSFIEEGLALYTASGDTWGRAVTTLHLGMSASMMDDDETARGRLEEALTLFRELDDTFYSGVAFFNLAALAWRSGDYARARALYEDALTAYRRTGSRWHMTGTLVSLARVADRQRDEAAADAFFAESLELVLHHTKSDGLEGWGRTGWTPSRPVTLDVAEH